MRYVILKKIGDIWFATRNRYTAKELEILVDRYYNDIVDFELIDAGLCQGLDDGVIIVKDDGRELNKNGRYLTDDLEIETRTEQQEQTNWTNIFAWIIILFVMCTFFNGAGAIITFILWLGYKVWTCVIGAVDLISRSK